MQPFPYSVVCRVLAVATLVPILAACNTMPAKTGDYAMVLDNAEAAVKAGRVESALVSFDEAARADPTSKQPWLRIAQLQFDAGNYGRAIVAAEEVLHRDPADQVADSVLTVSGLRIASQSLERLQGSGALASQTARIEAERLAATMRATMGETILDSGPPPAPKARTRAPTRRASTPTPKPATQATEKPKSASDIANPFGGMGN
ncbi:tetratricopeptide repeat protein [Lysobacter sp. A03]|uniref:tetratricopeptide repeat protein n=1 Tax=Lysobacter sp. A03 TaxID=1199154 RepID=UPI0005B72C44|nr:tetratricopeptide repeat protein [Lysobacter sp. A03]KIQ98076.1 TPR repeat [Lysobacter sp. A03]